MNREQVETLMSKDAPRPKCPACGSSELAFSVSAEVCGECGWFGDGLELEHTDLSRFLLGHSLHSGDQSRISYLTEIQDPEDRATSLQRRIEMHTLVEAGRETASLVSEVEDQLRPLLEAGDDVIMCLHRAVDGADLSGYAVPTSGGIVPLGSPLFSSAGLPGGPLPDDALVELMAMGGAWDFRDRISASESHVVILRQDPDYPGLLKATRSAYGIYPMVTYMAMTPNSMGHLSVVPERNHRDVSGMGMGAGMSGDPWVSLLDEISNQPIQWSMIPGPASGRIPRFLSVAAARDFSVMTCLSAPIDLDDSTIQASGALIGEMSRDPAGGTWPVGRPISRKVAVGEAQDLDEAILEMAEPTIAKAEACRPDGEVRIHRKTWSILHTDPHSIAYEIRKSRIWRDEDLMERLGSRRARYLCR